jgi:signal transduction histidine kinase
MKRYYVITVLMICISGSIIPVTYKYASKLVEENRISLVKNKRNYIVSNIISNITAIINYMELTSNNLNQTLSQEAADLPFKLINNNLLTHRITYFRLIRDSYELDQHIEDGKKIYNVSEFKPYNLVDGKAVYITNISYPLILLLMATPLGTSPGLPSVGTFNALSIESDRLISLINEPTISFYISPVIVTERLDGSINRVVSLVKKTSRWINAVQFDIDNMFNNVVDNDTILNVYSSTNTSLPFYSHNSDKMVKENGSYSTIDFFYQSWIIEVNILNYRNNTVTITIVVLVSLMGVIYILLMIAVKTFSILKKLSINKQILAIRSANSIVLHEIRNLLNSVYIIFQIKHTNLDRDDIHSIEKSINLTIDVISNTLDYERLLFGNVKLNTQGHYIDNIIKEIIVKYTFINIEYSYSNTVKSTIINVDKKIYSEIFQNGLNNAHKFSSDDNIIIKSDMVNDYVLTCIINKYQKIEVDLDDIFVPYFIKDKEHEWRNVSDRLKLNTKIVEIVAPFINTNRLRNTIKYDKLYHDNDELQIKSTGLGLSISRLAAKSHNGECGIMILPGNYICFWFIIKA